MVEYSKWDPPLVEAVPTVWLYGGRREEDASGATIFTASSYWPAQVSQVDNFRRQMRNPGGRFGIVDSDLWERDHSVVVMDLVGESFALPSISYANYHLATVLPFIL